ncbi:MAG: phenylalanine-4-hydroxylase [Flavobacteriales bacterium]
MVIDPTYAVFMQRFYWFTIEIGMIHQGTGTHVYGAGIISISSRTAHVLNNQIKIKKFDLDETILTSFENDVIQNLYFEIGDFNALYNSLNILEERIQTGLDVKASIVG